MSPFRPRLAAMAVAMGLLSSTVAAQSSSALKAAVERALGTSPEVGAKFHAYQAAAQGVEIARSGQRPRLELNADLGAERSGYSGGVNDSLSRSGVGLTLSQLLWDGQATQRDVTRAGHERLGRYFDLLENTEQTALETARAFYDVYRFRELVTLARDNFDQHRAAAEKIQSRVKAGVGRGVDLEQAQARLALAESNLATEMANLHDVSVRYQRIVGDLPPADQGSIAPLSLGMPQDAADALRIAMIQSPAVGASIEALRAARAGVQARESALQPRLEARLRTGLGNNYRSVDGRRSETAAEVLLNWNIFDGGANQARIRQQTNVVNQAMDLRDKACRDVRQTAAIAFNDSQKLTDQLGYLERNTQAIERARDAYRQQFDIGQRSLLDLLNAENETYTAKRALTNARLDRSLAYARTHAALSQLKARLGIARDGQDEDAAEWSAGDDGAGRCPVQTVNDSVALAMPGPAPMALAPLPTAAQALPVAAPVAMAAPVALPSRAPAPAVTTATDSTETAELAPALDAWAAAWRAKDFERYAAFYAPGFTGSEGSSAAWQAKRSKMLAKKGEIGVAISALNITAVGKGLVETRFNQRYTSNNFADTSHKVLTWAKTGKDWKIVKESNR